MDIVILGGGIVGLSAAYQLSRLGHRVTVVDADLAGRATDAGAGIVNPLDLTGDRSAAERQRAALSPARHYRNLLGQLAEDGATNHGYAEVGQVVVATGDADGAVVERLANRLSGVEPSDLADYLGPVRRLSAAEAREAVRYAGDVVAAVLLPGIARVDGRQLSACLTDVLRRRGVRWWHGTGRVVAGNGTAVGVEVGDERIDADRVIVATGAWLASTGCPDWLAAAIRPVRGQIVHLHHPHRRDGGTPILSSVGGPYVLGFPGDRIVTGATHEDAGFEYRRTAGGLSRVLAAALRVAPGLADASLLETRVGFRPVSRDGLPVIGPVPGLAGAVVATGLGAHGLTLGPAAGAVVARIAAGLDPGHDITALRPDRFAPA